MTLKIKLTLHSTYFENIPLKINPLDNDEKETMKLLNASSYNERKQRKKAEKTEIESRMVLKRCAKLIFLSSKPHQFLKC